MLFIPRNIWHHLRAKGALETEAQLPGTEAGSKYYDLCRGALADARTTFAWLDQQLAASAEVRVYHGPGISPPEVRKMEEIEQAGAQAKLDVQTLAERCEREHSEARGDDKLAEAQALLRDGVTTEAEAAHQTMLSEAAGGGKVLATDLDSVYAALDEAEEEYEAAEVPEKGAVVQRIRKRCMGVVFMAEAKALYEQKNFEECLKMATEAKFCFRDADDVVKTGETDRFFSRAEGDRIMTNYSPELKDGNYDAAM